MYCLDNFKDHEVYGETTGPSTDYTGIEIILMPCNIINPGYIKKGDSIEPGCIGDLEQ